MLLPACLCSFCPIWDYLLKDSAMSFNVIVIVPHSSDLAHAIEKFSVRPCSLLASVVDLRSRLFGRRRLWLTTRFPIWARSQLLRQIMVVPDVGGNIIIRIQ